MNQAQSQVVQSLLCCCLFLQLSLLPLAAQESEILPKVTETGVAGPEDATAEATMKSASKESEIEGNVRDDVEGRILLEVGQTYVLKTPKMIQKFTLSQQGIIEVANHSMRQIALTALSSGRADLRIDYEDGTSESHSFQVKSNSSDFASIIKQLFPKNQIEFVPIRDTAVFLRGTVETTAEIQQIEEIAGEFWANVHCHIHATSDPETSFVIPDAIRPDTESSTTQIPKGMRVVTLPILEWSMNSQGADFNRIVSIYTTKQITSNDPFQPMYSADEQLLAHGIRIFATAKNPTTKVPQLISAIMSPEQWAKVHQAQSERRLFILVSQILNETEPAKSPHSQSGPPQGLPPSGTLPENLPPSGKPDFSLPEASPKPTRPLRPKFESKTNPGQTAPDSRNNAPPSSGNDPFRRRKDSSAVKSLEAIPPTTVSEAALLRDELNKLRSDVQRLLKILEQREQSRTKKKKTEQRENPVPQTGPAVLFFNAEWCVPCQRMLPIVQKLQDEGLKIISVDIGQHPAVAQKYEITSLPTFLHIRDARPFSGGKTTGVLTEEGLRRFVKDLDPGREQAQTTRDLFAARLPRVVRIQVNRKSIPDETDSKTDNPQKLSPQQFSNTRKTFGSGFIMKEENGKVMVLTAAHLFRNLGEQDEVTVSVLSRREKITPDLSAAGKVISKNLESDLALVECEIPPSDRHFAPNWVSNALLNKDRLAHVIGFEVNGRSALTTSGKISSIDKYAGPGNFAIGAMSVHNGMSGAPVFNEEGGLCGIVTAYDRQENETVCVDAAEVIKFMREQSRPKFQTPPTR